jgi:hypothetical protein
MRDFPGLVWFTTRRRPPKTTAVSPEATVLYGARLVAMPFRIADIGAVPWSEHYGYATEEGKFLNAAAMKRGDDPRDWYISENPVSLEYWMEK